MISIAKKKTTTTKKKTEDKIKDQTKEKPKRASRAKKTTTKTVASKKSTATKKDTEKKPVKRASRAKKTVVDEAPKKRASRAKKTVEGEEPKKRASRAKKSVETEAPKIKVASKKKKRKPTLAPSINIGTAGHVDEGKSTLIKLLTNKFPDEHSEELKRGITIRLGYADCDILQCPNCEEPEKWTIHDECPNCGSQTEVVRRVSFVDAPGHEILMNVMLSGAAIMDGVMLLISATNKVPQPQTREHLAALTALGVNKIVIIQNKIDLVSKEEAMQNYQDIKKFIKGTIAEEAPIIPISALHGANLDILLSALQHFLPDPKRELDIPAAMMVARSFDINRPGTKPKKLKGGVFGGSILQGTLKIGDEMVLLPGLKKKHGKQTKYFPVKTTVTSINMGEFGSVDSATPGGLLGIQTTIDPSMARSDNLSGSIITTEDNLYPVISDIELEITLFDHVVGSSDQQDVKPIAKDENLLLTIGTATSIGNVEKVRKNVASLKINPNAVLIPETKIAISRRFDKRWRLIGWGKILEYTEIELVITS